MPDDDLIRLLHSLCCTKFKLLNKEPDNKVISKGDKFRWGGACGVAQQGHQQVQVGRGLWCGTRSRLRPKGAEHPYRD